MMRIILLLFFIALVPPTAFSNNTQTTKFINQAKAYHKIEKYDRALALLDKASVILDQDSAPSDVEKFQLFHVYGDCYLGKKELEKSFHFFQKSVSILEKSNQLQPTQIAPLWSSFGDWYNEKGEYEKAADYFWKYCVELKTDYQNDVNTEKLYYENYSSTGTFYLFAGQIVKAKEVYLKLINEFPKGKFYDEQYSTHSNLAYCYDELGDYDKAVEHWEICSQINLNLSVKRTNGVNNLGVYYFMTKKDFKKAEHYFKKVLAIIDNDDQVQKRDYCYAAKNLCTIYFENEELDKAYQYINIALKSAIDSYGLEYYLTNEILSEKGRILMFRGEIEEAEKLFAQAHKNLSIDPNDKSTFENIPFRSQLHNVILQQSKAYLELYHRTNDTAALQQGNFLADVNIAIIDSGRASLPNTDSKRSLMWSASAVFEVKIKILELLYQATKDQQYLNSAFELFEKTNNFILLEAVLKNEVANRMGLPQAIFDQENDLKARLAEAESKLYDIEEGSSNDTLAIKAATQLVTNARANYSSFLDELKRNHSKYFKLNYSDAVVGIRQLQENLIEDNQTLIHYYTSEEEIHCIAITKEAVDFFHIPNGTVVTKNIKTLQASILKANKKTTSKGFADLIKSSAELYQSLIQPIKIPLKSKLTIIPMGELSYIPFDVLLKTPPATSADFFSYEFLLKDHAISYGYSSTLLNDTNSKKITKSNRTNFVGFAPAFKSKKIASTRSEMVSLLHNESEVNKINQIIGGDIFSNQEATKEKFVDLCADYKILHLATHGVSNTDEGDNSYLAFSTDTNQKGNGLLYARDIYNLKIDSDLVVLSACETAVGELQAGEGIISLARAFTYAGARSSLTTLWQVNDEAASKLMQNFYKELKAGLPKDEALQNAKLAYLKNNPNEFTHPFYWSAFIPIGDMNPIDLETSFSTMQVGFFGTAMMLILGVGGFVFTRKKGTLKRA